MEDDIRAQVEKLKVIEEKRNRIKQGGGEAAVQKLLKPKNKLPAWQRIELLFDPGTFHELGLWSKAMKTGFENIDRTEIPRDAMMAGYGEVHGRIVYATCYDPTVLGGSQAAMQFAKIAKIMQQAREEGVPYVGIIDSAGRRIQDLFGRWGYRAPFRAKNCEEGAVDMFLPPMASGVIPQISLLLGPSVAGTAYSPVMSDFVFFRKGTSQMAVASPQLLKAVTFKDVTWEEIGGALMHATTAGTCDVFAESDEEALSKCRQLLTYLPSNWKETPPVVPSGDDPNRKEESLLGIAPADPSKPYDIHQVISLLTDKGDFFELQGLYAKNIVIGLARLDGQVVGIVANNPMVDSGALDADGCDKAGRFIRTCDAYNIPLIFLVDTPGFLPSAQQEQSQEGLERHAAKSIYAICESTVAKTTIYLRRCFGAGRLIMGSREMGVDAAFAWPQAKISLEEAGANGWPEEPFFSAGQMVIDDIIDPRETRGVLIKTLNRLSKKRQPERPWKKQGLIPL
jgi:acetyl-CoA carboxylase carboxyltransferase component